MQLSDLSVFYWDIESFPMNNSCILLRKRRIDEEDTNLQTLENFQTMFQNKYPKSVSNIVQQLQLMRFQQCHSNNDSNNNTT